MKVQLKMTVVLVLTLAISQCSSSSTSSTTSDADLEGASSAISALFSGESNASESVAQNILFDQIFTAAFAEAGVPGSNCDQDFEAEDNESPNITFTQLGEDGTYGPSGDSVTIDGTDEDFCENEGDWSTYEFETGQYVQFDCDDESSFFMTGGSGVWRETEDGTEVAGSFEISEDEDGTNGETVSCHGIIGEAEDLDLNCVDSNGATISETADLSCSTVED